VVRIHDRPLWIPYYLPHWSSRARSAARYEHLADGRLRLRIDADQEPWCPEFDGDVRVSSLQTGVRDGQHKFRDGLAVREHQEPERLHLPQYAHIEIRARFSDDPSTMAALWLIGFEDEPERSAEICVCEIFGREPGLNGMGIHPFGDASLRDDFERIALPFDSREPHTYAANWTEERVEFFLDGVCVKVSEQSPAYPMQLMLTLYAFDRAGPHPKTFDVDYVSSSPAIRRRASVMPTTPSAAR
jgi:hypothetical protein